MASERCNLHHLLRGQLQLCHATGLIPPKKKSLYKALTPGHQISTEDLGRPSIEHGSCKEANCLQSTRLIDHILRRQVAKLQLLDILAFLVKQIERKRLSTFSACQGERPKGLSVHKHCATQVSNKGRWELVRQLSCLVRLCSRTECTDLRRQIDRSKSKPATPSICSPFSTKSSCTLNGLSTDQSEGWTAAPPLA